MLILTNSGYQIPSFVRKSSLGASDGSHQLEFHNYMA